LAGPGGVLVGRGYVVIRPEFQGDWDRQVSNRTSRSGALGGRDFGRAFSRGASTALRGVGDAIKASFLGSGLAAATVGLQQVGAAAVAASAVAVPAISALGTAGAALGVGLKGVGAAFQAFGSAGADAKSAAAGARAIESAQRALAKAQAGVADARAQAARRVRDAEQTLADAQREAISVQQDLTDARKEATRQLEDLNQRLTDSALDQRDAAIRVREAEQELAAARATGDVFAIEKAQLAADRAKQNAVEQAASYKRLQEDADAANKAGVEGSDQVVAAKDKITQANRKVADAEQGLRDAQVDGAKQVRDAQEAVADAARSLADAQSAAAATVSKVDDAMAKLTPSAREFVETVKDLGPAWGEVRKATQESLFKGIAGSFRDMSTQIIPDVRDGLAGAASQINAMARNWMRGVKQMSQDGTLKRFFDSNNKILGNFTKWPEEATKGWVQLSIAATPALDKITKKVSAASTRLSERMTKAFESGAMERAISGAFDQLNKLRDPLRDIGTIFKNLFDAISGPGQQALGVFGVFLDRLAEVTSKPEVKDAISSIFSSFTSITGTVLDAVLPLAEEALPLLATGLGALADVLPGALDGLRQFGKFAWDKLAPPVQAAADGLVSLTDAFRSGGDVDGSKPASALEQVGAAARGITDKAADSVRGLFDSFRSGGGADSSGIVGVFERLGVAGRGFGDVLVDKVLPAAQSLARGIATGVTPVAEALYRIWTDHLSVALDTVASLIRNFVSPVLDALGGFIRDRVNPALQQLGDKLAGLLAAAAPIISFLDQVVSFALRITGAVAGFLIPVLLQLAGPVFTFLVNVLSVGIDMVAGFLGGITLLGQGLGWLGDQAVWVFTHIDDAARWLWGGIKDVGNGIAGVFQDISRWASGLYDDFALWFDKIGQKVSDILGGFKAGFQLAKDGVQEVWSGFTEVAAAPVRIVVDKIYNQGIAKVWNFIADKVHLPHLDEVPLAFASGGIYPGYTPGRDIGLAAVSGGEAIMRPEWTRAVGPGYVNAANAAAASGGVSGVQAFLGASGVPFMGGFSFGGIIGDAVKGAVSAVKKIPGVGDIIDKIGEIVRGGLAKAAELGMKPVRALINSLPGDSQWAQGIKGLPLAGIDGLISWLKGEDDKANSSGGVGSGVAPGQPGAALTAAMTQAGKPYIWGGTGPFGWDCSGLTQWAYGQAGYKLGRTTYDQVTQGRQISMSEALPGDLVFEHFGGAWPSHVGLYSSPGWIFNAPRTGDVVRFSPMANVVQARRVLDPAQLGKYDSGGWLMPGTTAAYNATGAPEPVLTSAQWRTMQQVAAGAADRANEPSSNGWSDGERLYLVLEDGTSLAAHVERRIAGAGVG
jgi:phage-related protein